MKATDRRLAFLGFGEAATAIARGLSGSVGLNGAAFDIKLRDPGKRESVEANCGALGVSCCGSPGEAVSGACAVFSLVTADQAVDAAVSVSGCLDGRPWYFDCNSCSPGAKLRAEAVIGSGGGRYVDVAVMDPVHKSLHRTPLLISGTDASEAALFLGSLDMSATVIGDRVGRASTAKLARSVFVKGREAILIECLLAARKAGVEGPVLSSLSGTFPEVDWRGVAGRLVGRMQLHGQRRGEEMTAAAELVRELGLPGKMSVGAADWQRRIGELDVACSESDLEGSLDRLLAALGQDRD